MSAIDLKFMRDGSTSLDPRLGCLLVKPDPRNTAYPFKGLLAARSAPLEPVNRRWEVTWPMDQGLEGCCVSMGIIHELMTPPLVVPPQRIDIQWCLEHLYWPAQQKDPWPGGEYPGALPRYSGTSLEAGLKVVRHDLKLAGGYRWATSVPDILIGIGHYRPSIMAMPMHQQMMRPDKQGMIRPQGALVGGHCMLADEVQLPRWRFNQIRIGFQQSWGKDYGLAGRVYITEADLEQVMAMGGQAAFLEQRKPNEHII